MQDIKIEKATNQRVENLPATRPYYIGFVRHTAGKWNVAGNSGADKDLLIDSLCNYWQGYDEYKIVVVDMPV